jgi:hypothetical protein
MNRRLRFAPVLLLAAFFALGGNARAQPKGTFSVPNPATGETYRVEFGASLWSPPPELVFSSESLGIAGTTIDAAADLGVEQQRFTELRLVLRPARKHKFRLHYLPIKYEANTEIQREIVFNGIRYPIRARVQSAMEWRTVRISYEYDFVYRDRGFVGLVLDAKYTDVQLNLDASIAGFPIASEFARARAPIPALGGIGRVYVAPNISITFEMTGTVLPRDIIKDYQAHYIDFDLYGTVNFTDHFGAQVGYRSLDVEYVAKKDSGTFKLAAPYLAGVVRF